MLEALRAASPNRFKGIRHIVTWDADPHVESREVQGVLSTPEFRAGAKVLGRMGLSLDTICCFPQLPEMVEFCRAVPEVTIKGRSEPASAEPRASRACRSVSAAAA